MSSAADPRSALPLLVLLLLAAGCGSGDASAEPGPPYPAGVTPAMVERGREVFFGPGGCHVCHGRDARGARGVGANLRDDEWWHSDGSYRGIVRQVRRGVDGSRARNVFEASMPPRGGSGIDDRDLRAVAAYVWSFRLLPDSASPLPSGPAAASRD